jgi:hypothetical protein
MHPRSVLALLHDVGGCSRLADSLLAAVQPGHSRRLSGAGGDDAALGPAGESRDVLARGLYRGIWRYASLHDLKRILLSVAAAALLVVAGMYVAQKTAVPRSVLILYPLLLVGLMGGSRLLYRAWKEHSCMAACTPGKSPFW